MNSKCKEAAQRETNMDLLGDLLGFCTMEGGGGTNLKPSCRKDQV